MELKPGQIWRCHAAGVWRIRLDMKIERIEGGEPCVSMNEAKTYGLGWMECWKLISQEAQNEYI